MWKQVDTKIALGMIIGNITGVTFGVILALMFANKHIVFNDFKEKTKKFKENSEYVFLDNVLKTNRDEILEYAELKGYQLYNFTLYINLHKPYLCNDISKREDATEEKIENSKKLLSKVKELIEKVFAKIKEKNVDCLSLIENPELLIHWNINLKQFQCKNNKMVLQVQSEDFLSEVQERCGTPVECQIKENDCIVLKLVENNVLLDKLAYKDKELNFIKIELKKKM